MAVPCTYEECRRVSVLVIGERRVDAGSQDKAVSRLTFRLHLTKSQKWKSGVLRYNSYSGGRAAFASV